MNQYENRVRIHHGSRYPMEYEFMGSPTIPVLPSHEVGMQTREYSPPVVSHEEQFDMSSASILLFSWWDDAEQQLQEIRLEVEGACELDSETEVVPESAYRDARSLLYNLHSSISIPDIMWLEDGGIGFEWTAKKGKGIATMSLYGDNQVVYGASLGSTRRVKGTCALSDFVCLSHFLTVLSDLCS